jgi:Zn-dependent protease
MTPTTPASTQPDRPLEVAADPEPPESAAVRQELVRVSGGSGLWLIASLVLFVVAQTSTTLTDVLVIVAVLTLHEGGHYLAMRAFGYRDLKVFFIPFFGAVASGNRAGVAAWKEAIVSLMGPLPGLALGCVLALVFPAPAGLTKTLILSLILINAFNLLPLGNLDGGRLFARILFSRHRYVEIGFAAVTGGLLLALALWLKAWPLGIFAWLGLTLLPYRSRLLGAASALRGELAGVTELRGLGGRQWIVLLEAAKRVAGRTRPATAKALATTMEAMLESLKPPPSVAASVAAAGLWSSGAVLALVGALLLFSRSAPSYWHVHPLAQTGLRVELPYSPKTTTPAALDHATPVVRLESGVRHWFAASAWTLDADTLAASPAEPPAVTARTPVRQGTFHGEELTYAAGGADCTRRVLRSATLLVLLEACSPPELGAERDRFMQSLREPDARR